MIALRLAAPQCTIILNNKMAEKGTITEKQKRICREGLAVIANSNVPFEVRDEAWGYQKTEEKRQRQKVPSSHYLKALDFIKRMVNNYPALADKVTLTDDIPYRTP